MFWIFRRKTFRNKRRNRSKTRKMRGGLFEFLSGIFGGPGKQEPVKAKMYALNDPNGPIVPGAGFTRTSFSLAPGVDYSYTTNAYGHKQAGLTGTIPAAVGLASFAQRVANPPAEGIFGLKGEASDFSKYPNPYFDLAVTEKSTNAEIKAAYNTKMRSANNSQKKILNLILLDF